MIGAAVLGFSLRRAPGESSFYWLTLVLAAVWIFGAFVSGPLHLGGINWRGRNQRPVITGMAIGLGLGGVFVLGGLIAREIPPVAALIARVLQFANQGSLRFVVLITLVNGVAEEVFFRGALYTALGRLQPVAISTSVHCATMASGNPMLGFAAIILGTVCAGAPGQRRGAGADADPLRVGSDHGARAAADVRRLTSALGAMMSRARAPARRYAGAAQKPVQPPQDAARHEDRPLRVLLPPPSAV